MAHVMTPVHQNFPAEVLEMFIDELGRSSANPESYHALQQWALVSRAFRSRANHHLFSKIEFIQSPYTVPSRVLLRMHKFREVLSSGQDLPLLTGLLHHVRSLKLVMEGSIFQAYAILENNDLVAILRCIQELSKGIKSFTVKGYSFHILWSDLTTEFRDVFKTLCQTSPDLTRLHLANMVGVPHTLLMGTSIKHVSFHFIEFKKPRMPFVIFRDGYLPKGQLESLDIDYTFPFPPSDRVESRLALAYEDAMAHCRSIFCNVKWLRYKVYRLDDLKRFAAVSSGLSSSLEDISLELSNMDNGFLRALACEIPLGSLPFLRRLSIQNKSLVTAAGTRHSFLKVSALLRCSSVPPSLETIELAFEVAAQAPWLKTSHFFPQRKSWALLDADLMNDKFKSVKYVVLKLRYFVLQEQPWTYDEVIFRERCRQNLKDVWPMVSDPKSNKQVELTISTTVTIE